MRKEDAIAELKRKKKSFTQEAFVNSVRNNIPHLVNEYIVAGFDVNTPDKKGTTPLAAAIESDDANIVQQLLDYGAKADDASYFFDAIYNAPFLESVEIIDILVAVGCPVNFIEETTGFDALALARDMGSPIVIHRIEEIMNSQENST